MMDQQELDRKITQLYRKADYQTRKKMDREIHRILTRSKGERLRKKAFFEAVKDGNVTAVENIFKEKKHVDVNVKDEKLGNTALIYAILSGYEEIVKVLLDNGADPFIENKKGKNSLDAVKLTKNPNEMIALISKYNQ